MAEKKTVELEVQTNLGSLKSQLQAAQREVYQMSEAFGATSEQAAKAATKAAALKDAIGDAKALTDAFNPDAKFNALSSSIGGVLNGFEAYQGVLGLVGVESEDLQKTMLKVQSAMALSQGIQGALEAKDSFVQLGSVVKNTFGAMTTASKAFLVGGIGLVIAAVGLIVANYDEWFGASKKVAEQQKRISEQAKEQRENIAKESGEFATLISRLKNTNSGTKEREDLIKKINGQYGTTLKNIKDETKFQESLNKELASYLEYQKAKYQLQKNEDLIVKNLSKQDELRAKIAKAEKDRDKALADGAGKQKRTLEEGITTYVNLNEEADKALKKANETISKSNKELESAEKRFNAYGSAANTAAKNVDEITNSGTKYVEKNNEVADSSDDSLERIAANQRAATDLFKTEYEIQKRDIEEKYAAEIELAKKFNKDTVDLEKAKKKELQDLEDKQAKDLFDGTERLILLDTKKTKVLVGGEKKRAEDTKTELVGVQDVRDRIYKRLTELDEDAKKKRENNIKGIQDSLSIISDITTLFAGKSKKAQEKAFKIQKAVNIASAIVDTYKAANMALASAPPPVGFIAMGAAITAGLVNIKKITSTQFQGGETPPSNTPSGGGGGGTMSPSFNVVGNSGINQLAQLQQTPTKAYVVSGDVTTAQSLDRNRIENATLVK